MDTIEIFTAMNIIGLVAFAFVGSFKGIQNDLDLLGVVVLGITTALGGGTVRDILVSKIPMALQSPTDISVALAGVVLGLTISLFITDIEEHSLILVPDAIGLAAFATTGAVVAADADLTVFGVVGLATVTAVGGGAIADILVGQTPCVLTEDFMRPVQSLGVSSTGSSGQLRHRNLQRLSVL
jgi:uncharacterized membrane protein YeiH